MPDLSDDENKQFVKNVEKHGWMINQIRNAEGEEGPTFSYSTGMFKNVNHPEIIIVGLSNELEKSIINEIGKRVREGGEKFGHGNVVSGLIEGFETFIVRVDDKHRTEYATWSDWFYDRKPFELLQVVWPTTSGKWPWTLPSDEPINQVQPILGPLPDRLPK